MASTLVNSKSGIAAILIRDWLSIAESLFASKPGMTWMGGEPRLRLLGPEFRVYDYDRAD